MSQNRIKNSNRNDSPLKKGKPSGEGKAKAGSKPVLNLDDEAFQDEISDTYTDGPDQPAANVRQMHPNRNTDKSEIDNNSY